MRGVARLRPASRDARNRAGASVGYDATWSATRPTRLATIGAGYADGLPIGASSGAGEPAAQALVRGARCPIVGRVSMDFHRARRHRRAASRRRRGDWAEILGDDIRSTNSPRVRER